MAAEPTLSAPLVDRLGRPAVVDVGALEVEDDRPPVGARLVEAGVGRVIAFEPGEHARQPAARR